MAKSKLAGKEISNEVNIGGGQTLINFTDGTFIIINSMSDVLEPEELGLTSSDEAEDDEEDEEEEEEEKPKAKKGKKVEEDEEEEELTADDLMGMDEDDLEDVVDDYELDIDIDDYEDDVDGLRAAVAEALDITLPLAKAKGKDKGKKGKKK